MSIFDTQSVLTNFMDNTSARGMKENYELRKNPNYLKQLFGIDDNIVEDDSSTSNIDTEIINNEMSNANTEEDGGFKLNLGFEPTESSSTFDSFADWLIALPHPWAKALGAGNIVSGMVGGPTVGTAVDYLNEQTNDFLPNYAKHVRKNYPWIDNTIEGAKDIGEEIINDPTVKGLGLEVEDAVGSIAEDVGNYIKDFDQEQAFNLIDKGVSTAFDMSPIGVAIRGGNFLKNQLEDLTSENYFTYQKPDGSTFKSLDPNLNYTIINKPKKDKSNKNTDIYPHDSSKFNEEILRLRQELEKDSIENRKRIGLDK